MLFDIHIQCEMISISIILKARERKSQLAPTQGLPAPSDLPDQPPRAPHTPPPSGCRAVSSPSCCYHVLLRRKGRHGQDQRSTPGDVASEPEIPGTAHIANTHSVPVNSGTLLPRKFLKRERHVFFY